MAISDEEITKVYTHQTAWEWCQQALESDNVIDGQRKELIRLRDENTMLRREIQELISKNMDLENHIIDLEEQIN